MKKLINKVVALITKNKLTTGMSILIVLGLVVGGIFTYNYFDQQEKEKLALAADREKEKDELMILFAGDPVFILEESTFDYSSIVNLSTGIVSYPLEPLDTTILGPVEIIYTVTSEKYSDISKDYVIVITVVEIDKTPVINGVQDYTITAGGKIDLLENVSAFDYKGKGIKVDVIGNYDITRVGTYKLTYYAIDEKGNEISIPFVLTVTKKSSGSGSGNNNNGSNTGNNNNGGNNNTGDNNNGNNNNNGTVQACPNAKHDPNIGCDEIPSHVDKGDEFFPGANAGNTCYYAYLDENGQGVNFPPGAKNYFCTPVENNMGNTGGFALHWVY